MGAQASILVATAEVMKALGVRLGQTMRVGDVVALHGQLGSGKTTLAQGLATGLGVPPERHVASPTFALVNEHQGKITFVHADLYRIKHAAELQELGLEEASDRAAVAIEWADLFPQVLPQDHLVIALEAHGEARRVSVVGTGARGRALAEALLATPGL